MNTTLNTTSADPKDRLIADLQRQLAASNAERDEAIARETATAEVLQMINSSPGNLVPVFDAMLERATRLCEADFGTLWTFDGDRFRPAVGRGHGAAGPNTMPEGVRPAPGVPLGRLIAGEDVVHVVDVATDDAFQSDPALRSRTTALGTRSALAVALRKDNALLGAITASRKRVEPYSDKQIALLNNFAGQAMIAMENARLLTETREALEQQTATAEVLGVINSSPGDLAPVFDAILEKAHGLCGVTYGSLQVYDGERFRAVAVRGLPEELANRLRQGYLGSATPASQPLVEGERVVQITDLAEIDHPMARRAVELAGMRTLLSIALRKDDALLGMIVAGLNEVRPFSEKQIALLQNFAAQAVIAMENARLLSELRQRTGDLEEALEQQTATTEVLQVINASPGDLAPVFDAILEKAHTLCSAELGALATFDGKLLCSQATRGYPEPLMERLRRGYPPADNWATQPLLDGVPLVHIPDCAEIDSPYARSMVDATGMRTVLLVALHKDNAFCGMISAARTEVRPFSDKEIALLQNFAAQAVIAMENARLITETREALEQQTATAEVLGVINSSPGDLAPVFDVLLERATRLCEASFGYLLTYDGERLHPAADRGHPSFAAWIRAHIQAQNPHKPEPGTSNARLLAGEDVVHIPDITDDAGVSENSLVRRALIEIGGFRTILSIALRREGSLLGIIHIYRQEVRPFTDKQIALLQNFAAQAVIAMENARLLAELRQRTDEVAELNRGLEARVAEQVDELGRVGRLKRFLAPQLAELIVSQGDEKILESHRREIVVVFCDLRGYTAFTETAEPEEVLEFLRQYHGALGPLVSQFEGTLDQFSGDGIMVFFNDPVPCPDPAERAVKMAVAMREAARELIAAWSRHGCELGFGVGIAQGFATLGQIGFSERSGYTAIGTVCNLAARLCAEAKDGQILISSRIAEAVEGVARLEDLGNLELKGLRRPVAAFNVVRSTSPAEARPNLTVVARDTGA